MYANPEFEATDLYGDVQCGTDAVYYGEAVVNTGKTVQSPLGDSTTYVTVSTQCIDAMPVHMIASVVAANETVNVGQVSVNAIVNGMSWNNTIGGYVSNANSTMLMAPLTDYSAYQSVAVAFWVKPIGRSTVTHAPIVRLGHGLTMTASINSDGSLNVCILDVLWLVPFSVSGTNCSLGAPFSTAAVAAPLTSNGWIHVAFVLWRDNGFALYSNGMLAKSGIMSSNYTAHYSAGAQSIGILTPAWARNGGFAFNDFEVYVNAPHIYGAFMASFCTYPIESVVAMVEQNVNLLGVTTLSTSMPSHVFLNYPYRPMESAQVNASGLVNLVNGVSPIWIASSGSILPSTYGYGWSTSPNASVQFRRDKRYGYDFVASNGYSFTFWIFRNGTTTTNVQLLDVPLVGRGTTFRIEVNTGMNVMEITWPGCTGMRFSDRFGSFSSFGVHYIAVVFGSTSLTVYINGNSANQISRGATFGTCTASTATWPLSLQSAPVLGNPNGDNGSAVTLLGFAVYPKALTSDDVLAKWASSGVTVLQFLTVTLQASTLSLANLPRIAACQMQPPDHRYGNAVDNGYVYTTLFDRGQVGGWDVQWTSNVAQRSTSGATISVSTTLINASAIVDFGAQTLSGSGLTISFLVDTPLPCSPTIQISGLPSSLVYFDFGGYSMYSIGSSCAEGSMVTYLTDPYGTVMAIRGKTGTSLPFFSGRYTTVSFGRSKTVVYVAGRVWGITRAVQWREQGVFTSTTTYFAGGNTLASALTIHDLQIYSRPLHSAEVAGLDRGVEEVC